MNKRCPTTQVSMGQYVQRRNGVPLGGSGALSNMLKRSLGAGSFMGFWRYWNPIFGYALGRYIYRPLVCQLPRSLAYVLTFIACGLIHDAVTLLVKGSTHFLFGYWFFFMSVVALVASALNFRFQHWPFTARVLTQLCYLYSCYLMAFYSSRSIDLYGY